MFVSYWCTITISHRIVNKNSQEQFSCCFFSLPCWRMSSGERPWSVGPTRHKHIQLYSTNVVLPDVNVVRARNSVAWWWQVPWCTNPKKILQSIKKKKEGKRITGERQMVEPNMAQTNLKSRDRSQTSKRFYEVRSMLGRIFNFYAWMGFMHEWQTPQCVCSIKTLHPSINSYLQDWPTGIPNERIDTQCWW